jgi:hypothetical protein
LAAQVRRFRLPGQGHELRIGQVRRQVLLGTEALYRVRKFGEELVEVEVVRAPGLRPGGTFSLKRDAVENMDLVVDPV